MKKMLIILSCLLFAMAGCNKDKEDPKPTVSDMLVDGVWKMSLIGIDMNANHVVDAGETLAVEPCTADDTYDYIAGGTLQVKDNALQCDPDVVGDQILSWSLSSNDTILTWSMPGETESVSFKIIAINPNGLTLEYEDGGDYYFIVFGR